MSYPQHTSTLRDPPRIIDPNQPVNVQYRVLQSLITRPPEGARRYVISPGLAGAIIEGSIHNRPRSPITIQKYQQDIEADFWLFTGDTVKFGVSGKLVDGQHRMIACIKANKSFTTLVAFGIDDDVFTRIDRGKKRTAADMFYAKGVSNPKVAASAVRWYTMLRDGTATSHLEVDPAVLLDTYNNLANEGFADFVNDVKVAISHIPHMPPGSVAGLFFILAQKNEHAVQNLIKDLGARRGKAKVFLEALEELSKLTGNRVPVVVRLMMLTRTWRAYASREQLRKTALKFSPIDDFPSFDVGS